MSTTSSKEISISYWQTNVIIASYLVCTTVKTHLMYSEHEQDGKTALEYPFLHLMIAYLGEFVFTILYYIYKAFVMNHQVR